MKNNKGFTLIELIMVTIILGILAAVAVPRYMGTVSQAEAAAEKAVIDALKAAVENYATQEFLEKGRYDYPSNPFELVDVDGYCGSCDGGMVDGSWKYVSDGDFIQSHTKEETIACGTGRMILQIDPMLTQMTEVVILVLTV